MISPVEDVLNIRVLNKPSVPWVEESQSVCIGNSNFVSNRI
jgi:hypothetical protein